MGVLGEKLTLAGYDTFEAQFQTMAIDAIRESPNPVDAWRRLGATFGHRYMADLERESGLVRPTEKHVQAIKPVVPREVSKAAKVMQRRSQAARLIELRFNYKMADGVDLAEVRAHEMAAHERDGALMAELKKELPQLSGNMRFATLGELLTHEQVARARQRANV